ncbi:hypothetical protein PFISCL1PPCAC_22121, partial [Pristionchus fissidentatus]
LFISDCRGSQKLLTTQNFQNGSLHLYSDGLPLHVLSFLEPPELLSMESVNSVTKRAVEVEKMKETVKRRIEFH